MYNLKSDMLLVRVPGINLSKIKNVGKAANQLLLLDSAEVGVLCTEYDIFQVIFLCKDMIRLSTNVKF